MYVKVFILAKSKRGKANASRQKQERFNPPSKGENSKKSKVRRMK